MANMVKMIIGKNGLTPEFIVDVKRRFNRCESMRIGLLKSATRSKKEVKGWADTLVLNLGKNFTHKIIGYTIVIRKWRKARTPETE